MENFKLNEGGEWVCKVCGSTDIRENSPPPSTEEIYQEIPDGYGDTIEALVTVITESYVNVTCNKCHASESETY